MAFVFKNVVQRTLALAVSSAIAWHALDATCNAGVFKVPVYQSGTEGYSFYRIPMVKGANGDLLAFTEARAGGDGNAAEVQSLGNQLR